MEGGGGKRGEGEREGGRRDGQAGIFQTRDLQIKRTY